MPNTPHDSGFHHVDTGPAHGPVLVLVHGLGTDLTIWDDCLPLLPKSLRILRFDLRGHGRSAVPAPPYSMGTMIRDAEVLLDQQRFRDCVFVGLGLGGLIAQGLAVKRLDQVRALVLTGTAAKWGTPEMWHARATLAQTRGMALVADQFIPRWFSAKAIRQGQSDATRAALARMHPDGFAGGCLAISGTDFLTPTSGLRLPVLGLAGADDRATPPDLMRETVQAIPGARFELMRRAGHLTCIDQPAEFARLISGFLQDIGHI